MEVIFNGIIAILVFVMFFTIDKTVKYYRQKKLFELVSWSVIGDYNPFHGSYSYINALIFQIRKAQQNDIIDEKYKIVTDDDFKIVREIVEEYQKNIARLYFCDTLGFPKSKYVISETDYFMAAFRDFLSEHSAKSEFMGHDMYSERKDYEIYEGGGYRATYAMSDFGVLYYKLYYMTQMYCKKSVVYQNKVADWAEENIKDALDKNEIEISCFRH